MVNNCLRFLFKGLFFILIAILFLSVFDNESVFSRPYLLGYAFVFFPITSNLIAILFLMGGILFFIDLWNFFNNKSKLLYNLDHLILFYFSIFLFHFVIWPLLLFYSKLGIQEDFDLYTELGIQSYFELYVKNDSNQFLTIIYPIAALLGFSNLIYKKFKDK
jgi:hypothetical protein